MQPEDFGPLGRSYPIRKIPKDRLEASVHSIYRLINEGRLRTYLVGNRRYTCDKWLDEFIAASEASVNEGGVRG